MSSLKITKNTGKIQWTYCKLYQHEKGHRNYQQEPRGNEEYNFWIEEDIEGIKSRLDEVEDRISELKGIVGKNSLKEQEKEKRLKKNDEELKETPGQHEMQ